MTKSSNTQIEQAVEQWLLDVVIGLNLCPFAAKPQRNQQIRIFISQATTEQDLLEDLLQEFLRLEKTPVAELETTLVVAANML
ncbi:MAG: DUF1415 family protein, partial [Vibrio sp.]